ncbi:transposase [Agrobacterium tumefaciens]|nr:transposase [Agrobacterium tumefaciens]
MTQIKFIGLDVHKETIAVAVVDEERASTARFYGLIPNTPDAVRRLFDRLSGPGIELHVCYEAGGCGYGLYRQLSQLTASCTVVAPSKMPKKPGDRIKNDRRDAVALARLLRAGELTAVWVPDEHHEAMRDLVRARRQAKTDFTIARQMLHGFLLRHGRKYPGRKNWTRSYWKWLGEQAFAYPHQQFVFAECLRRIEECQGRCERLDKMLEEAVANWSLAPLVRALQALRGVRLVVAATLVAEIGDLSRFCSPKHLMSWLGLVPSESSSGKRTRRGAITGAGNGEARAMLVEAAWCYHYPAREAWGYRKRVEGLPDAIRSIGWKAQTRLCQRYRRLVAAGKPPAKVIVAIARELVGFVWDIARKTPPASC